MSHGARSPRSDRSTPTRCASRPHKLTASGAEVTWNDRVPDPDNPGQPRQIDVTIKRAGALTLIECRIHKRPQGVKWIEELMGRRTSLRAVGVIAVSSSGFSKGARLKAAKHQVELRNLQELSDREVLEWGRSVSLSLMCYQYSDVTLSLLLDGDSDVDVAAVSHELRSHPVWRTLFNQASKYLTSQGLITPAKIKARVQFGLLLEPAEDFCLADRRVKVAELAGRASVLVLPVQCPVIEAYESPAGARSAIVERFDLGETSIIHEGERVSVFVDVSQLNLPPLCQFQFVRTVGEQEMDFSFFSLVGVEKLAVSVGTVNIQLGSYAG